MTDTNQRRPVSISIQGKPCEADADESVLVACLRHGDAAPQVICGMGSCYACVVTRSDGTRVRACISQVQEGESYDW